MVDFNTFNFLFLFSSKRNIKLWNIDNITGLKSYFDSYPLTLNIILIAKYCGGCDCNNFQLHTVDLQFLNGIERNNQLFWVDALFFGFHSNEKTVNIEFQIIFT